MRKRRGRACGVDGRGDASRVRSRNSARLGTGPTLWWTHGRLAVQCSHGVVFWYRRVGYSGWRALSRRRWRKRGDGEAGEAGVARGTNGAGVGPTARVGQAPAGVGPRHRGASLAAMTFSAVDCAWGDPVRGARPGAGPVRSARSQRDEPVHQADEAVGLVQRIGGEGHGVAIDLADTGNRLEDLRRRDIGEPEADADGRADRPGDGG